MTDGLSRRGGQTGAARGSDDKDRTTPDASTQGPSESEIEDAVERLSEKWAHAAAAQRSGAAPGLVVQSLAPGRKRAVTVEVKRPPRPRGPSKSGEPGQDGPATPKGERK